MPQVSQSLLGFFRLPGSRLILSWMGKFVPPFLWRIPKYSSDAFGILNFKIGCLSTLAVLVSGEESTGLS